MLAKIRNFIIGDSHSFSVPIVLALLSGAGYMNAQTVQGDQAAAKPHALLNAAISHSQYPPEIRRIKVQGVFTYASEPTAPVPVTLTGDGEGRLSIDIEDPRGHRREIWSHGTITISTQDQQIEKKRSSDAFIASLLVSPYLWLSTTLQRCSPPNITDEGMVEKFDERLHAITVSACLRPSGSATKLNSTIKSNARFHFQNISIPTKVKLYIDPSTYSIKASEDIVPTNQTRMLRFSKFTSTGGMMTPFEVQEYIDGNLYLTLSINTIDFHAQPDAK